MSTIDDLKMFVNAKHAVWGLLSSKRLRNEYALSSTNEIVLNHGRIISTVEENICGYLYKSVDDCVVNITIKDPVVDNIITTMRVMKLDFVNMIMELSEYIDSLMQGNAKSRYSSTMYSIENPCESYDIFIYRNPLCHNAFADKFNIGFTKWIYSSIEERAESYVLANVNLIEKSPKYMILYSDNIYMKQLEGLLDSFINCSKDINITDEELYALGLEVGFI